MFKSYVIMSCFLMVVFSMCITPIPLGIALFFTSVFVVFLMSILLSSWYGYILFLVYVGGLLVLFMYMCIMSSNMSFFSNFSFMTFTALTMVYLVSEKFWSETTKNFLGFSNFESSYSMSMSIFLGLTLILLFSFLSIIRIVEMKKPLIVDF
uniref:NADH dehydrogenase subunit 6 n=1 Tax=Bulinus globosus TaxID=157967 RepID=UPI001EDFC2BD|nr:NADH dehydrogenase subunit 6 [Bulinus globosus]QYJ56681.1 NADH dehydrogenase subunit 6 [Bulinus globosus]